MKLLYYQEEECVLWNEAFPANLLREDACTQHDDENTAIIDSILILY
jgi:hypothetical protein